jgi:hypothetical protein
VTARVIAIDAMGSDRAPGPDVAGAIAAVREAPLEVLLVGDGPRLEAELARIGAARERGVTVVHAPEVVAHDEHPGAAYRAKRQSSLRVAIDQVASGAAGALVSAGNSGAVLAHALFVLGRSPGVERPALITVFPTTAGPLTLGDVGANVEPRPSMLAQFAVLGAAYDRAVHGRSRPRVGLLANGTEPTKGTELTRAAALLIAAAAPPGRLRVRRAGRGLGDLGRRGRRGRDRRLHRQRRAQGLRGRSDGAVRPGPAAPRGDAAGQAGRRPGRAGAARSRAAHRLRGDRRRAPRRRRRGGRDRPRPAATRRR